MALFDRLIRLFIGPPL